MKTVLSFLLGVLVANMVAVWRDRAAEPVRVVPTMPAPATAPEEARVEPHGAPDVEINIADNDAVDIGEHLLSDDRPINSLEPDNSDEYTIVSDKGSDGYRVDRAEFDHSRIDLRVFKYRTEAEFQAAIRATDSPKRTQGVTYSTPNSNQCIIMVRDPAFYYDPATLGHELVHCIYGGFHERDEPDAN